MPSIIRVTNVGNGRSVVLRVNDRGPYHGDRVLDVSEAAAEELGFKALGTALVRIEVLERPSRLAAITARAGAPIEQLEAIRADAESGRTPAATPPATALASIGRDVGSEAPPADVDIAFVQTGAFGEYSNARRAVARVSAIGEADIVPTDINGDRIYRVRLGPYNGIRAAEGVLVEVTRLGVQGAHIVVVR
jgi:rare lipoprotein A